MKRKNRKIREKTSIKWKVFLYLLSFTVVLLAILWVFQICYLDTFYKFIKNREAQKALTQVVDILKSGEEDAESEIDYLAAEGNLSVLVTDTDGNMIHSAEYILNSKMSTIPKEEFEWYYEQAKEQGGKAKIEFEGNQNVTMLSNQEQPPLPEEAKKLPPDREDDFSQKRGQKAQSAVYVEIMNDGTKDMVVMVNSQLTPVDATVDTLRIQFVWISVILIFCL